MSLCPAYENWGQHALIEEARRLWEEVQRLRAGTFTPDEFQAICHNLDVQAGRAAFEAGCREYQDKLFGPKLEELK